MLASKSTESLPLWVLTGSILCFGAVSAFFALRGAPSVPPRASAVMVSHEVVPLVEKVIEPEEEVLRAPSAPVKAAGVPVPATKPAPVVRAPSPPVTKPAVPAPLKPVPAAPPKPLVPPTTKPTSVGGQSLSVQGNAKPSSEPLSPAPALNNAKNAEAGGTSAVVRKPEVQQVIAKPLIAPKPVVVLATKDKAWVKLDERTTVIVTRGETVSGLGKFLESDGKSVKFESATVPVTTE